MSADELTPGERVMHVGSGTLQFADEQILIPVCLAKLIQSARADDVTASIINSHNGIKLTGSALRLTFHPGSDIPNASRKDIRLDFLLDPLMLIAVTTRPHQPGSGLFEKVPLIEFCDPSEILLMTPSNK